MRVRRALAIGLGALALAGAGLALLPALRTSRLDPPLPQPPQPRAGGPDAAARPVTRVAVPLDLPMRAILDLANARGPTALSGTHAPGDLKQSTDTSIAWTLSRSAFTGAGEGGRLVLGAALTGGASLRGRTRAGRTARGGLGRTLPRAFNESIDVAADIRVTAEPRLTPGWRVEPAFRSSASLRQGEARIADLFTLDLRTALQPGIEAALKQELDALSLRIARDPFLESAGRAAWDRLCTSLAIPGTAGRGEGGESSVWLDIEPKGWVAGQPVIAAESVTLPLSARASVSLSDAPRAQAECEAFPERLDLTDAPSGDGRIALGTLLDLAGLSATATAQIARDNRLAAEGASAALETVGLSALGDRVTVTVEGRFQELGLLGADASGRLHFLAEPRLDPEAAELSLEGVAIAPASAEALARAGGGLSALAPAIARRLGSLRFDLARQRDGLAAMARAAQGLKRPDGPLGVAELTLGAVRLVGLRPSPQGLRLRAEAEGSLALRPIVLSP